MSVICIHTYQSYITRGKGSASRVNLLSNYIVFHWKLCSHSPTTMDLQLHFIIDVLCQMFLLKLFLSIMPKKHMSLLCGLQSIRSMLCIDLTNKWLKESQKNWVDLISSIRWKFNVSSLDLLCSYCSFIVSSKAYIIHKNLIYKYFGDVCMSFDNLHVCMYMYTADYCTIVSINKF